MAREHLPLINACRKGESRAQHELYEWLAPKMMAVCYRYAATLEEAEDIMQEGFVKVFRNLDRYKDKGSFEGWVRRIIVNTAIDHIRRNRMMKFHVDIEECLAPELTVGPLESLELEALMQLIRQLPDGYRLVFNLYAIEGYSHAEIGQKLDISESTSRSQYTRARAQLKKVIQKDTQLSSVYRDAG